MWSRGRAKDQDDSIALSHFLCHFSKASVPFLCVISEVLRGQEARFLLNSWHTPAKPRASDCDFVMFHMLGSLI